MAEEATEPPVEPEVAEAEPELQRPGSQQSGEHHKGGDASYACGYIGGAGEKGDRSFISSKLISEDAVGMCVKVSGLEGLQVDQVLGDGVSLDEEEFAEICKVMEDDQADIYKDVYRHFLEYFKRIDEEGQGKLLGDTFKSVLTELEESHGMSFMTDRAAALIKTAEACAKDPDENKGLEQPEGEGEMIFYEDFLRKELKSPRDLKL